MTLYIFFLDIFKFVLFLLLSVLLGLFYNVTLSTLTISTIFGNSFKFIFLYIYAYTVCSIFLSFYLLLFHFSKIFLTFNLSSIFLFLLIIYIFLIYLSIVSELESTKYNNPFLSPTKKLFTG